MVAFWNGCPFPKLPPALIRAPALSWCPGRSPREFRATLPLSVLFCHAVPCPHPAPRPPCLHLSSPRGPAPHLPLLYALYLSTVVSALALELSLSPPPTLDTWPSGSSPFLLSIRLLRTLFPKNWGSPTGQGWWGLGTGRHWADTAPRWPRRLRLVPWPPPCPRPERRVTAATLARLLAGRAAGPGRSHPMSPCTLASHSISRSGPVSEGGMLWGPSSCPGLSGSPGTLLEGAGSRRPQSQRFLQESPW